MTNEWWHSPQRIVQTNLRLIDASLDPETLAAELADFGATAMLFNVGGIFAWYPSQLPMQAQNPRLDRDLLGEMIAAAHRHSIRFIGRYDLSKGTSIAYDAHPEWFCVNREGKPFEYNGTYQACVNGDWYQEQAPRLLEETLGHYEIDGLFFNMFGYLATDYSFRDYGLCHCNNCKTAFREFAGADLPTDRQTSNPIYRKYLQFQDVTSAALKTRIYDLVKSIRPAAGISNMGRRSDFFRGELNRRVDRPRPEWAYQGGEQARTFRSIGRNRVRHSSGITHFIDFPWRNSAENAAAQTLRLAQQVANGADPHYYVMGPLNQADRKALPAVRAIFQYRGENEEAYANLDSIAQVALYVSQKSRRFDPGGGSNPLKAFRGAYRALLEAGLVFDLIDEDRATDDDFAATHARYDTIVLSGVSCLSDTEIRNLDAYVAAGGTLLTIGPTGEYDEVGNARAAGLKSLPIENSAAKPFDSRGAYLIFGDNPLDGLDTDLVMLDGPYAPVSPKPGAQTLYNVQMPQRFGPPELCFTDDAPSDVPGVVIGSHGKGRGLYVPFALGGLYMDYGLLEYRKLLAELATRYGAPQSVALSRTGRIEVTAQRQEATGELLIHLINYSGQNDNTVDEAIPVHDLTLTLTGIGAASARTLVTCKSLDEVGDPKDPERQTLKLPPLGAFEAIVISTS